MNKAELIDGVLARVEADRKSVERVVAAVFDQIIAEVSRGGRVALAGFGTFHRRERAARTARNPQTGATVKVNKRNVPAFKAAAPFKDTVASGKLPAKKTAAKKATAKKGAAKKTTATATAGKAAPATKAAAKKAPAKKTTAKKAPAKPARARTSG